MPKVTVLIPTLDHADTLKYAIRSVQNQTIQDFEILVVGDGSPERTNVILQEIIQDDSRVKYLPHPKGEAHGELYRHEALLSASGEIVCYLCDDDMWLPQHLEILVPLLEKADFAHTLHLKIWPGDIIVALGKDINNPAVRQKMLAENWNIFGPTCVAHTLDAYLRLPLGWNPRPENMFSDLHMWRQWLSQAWCRFHSEPVATILHFPSTLRTTWSIDQRLEELDRWSEKLLQPDFYNWLNHEIVKEWQGRITTVNVFFSAISTLIQTARYTEANSLVDEALLIDYHSARLHLFKSILLNKLGNIEASIESAKIALEYAPDNDGIRQHLQNLQNKSERTSIKSHT